LWQRMRTVKNGYPDSIPAFYLDGKIHPRKTLMINRILSQWPPETRLAPPDLFFRNRISFIVILIRSIKFLNMSIFFFNKVISN